ncbi:hypothetical protein N7475_003342 [Penicillium sp. IBT 31633x]|nr:hypothetical protein N7475_003342 [Penicillium sp. IBT 31633x]
MAFAKSLKTDPLGTFDTRLMMDSPVDTFFSPLFERFDGFDGTADKPDKQSGSQTEADASPQRAHRILELRKSFHGFEPNRKCPRLELDVAVDKYHSLDGLTDPLNPNNTPASNSERGSTEETTQSLRCYKTENIRMSPASQTDDFNFDCFQDSPEANYVRQDNGSESPAFPKLRRFPIGSRRWINPPVSALADHHAASNASPSKTSSNPNSVPRCVRFSPASLSPTSRAARRPLPSIERRQDHIALYRHKKQHQKWKVIRRARGSPCNSPKKMTQSLAGHIPKDPNVRVSSLSDLSYRETHQKSLPARVGLGSDIQALGTGNMAHTPVADDLNLTHSGNHKIPDFFAVSFSLYRIRRAPDSFPEKAAKYAFKFRISQTYLPKHPSPHFPTTLEHIACCPVIDGLLFHTCFILPALVVLAPSTLILFATWMLTETQAGALMVRFGRGLLYVIMKIVILGLAKCGCSCSCQWNLNTRPSD